MSGYGWKYTLIGPVAIGAVLDMPAPGASNPDCDLSTATFAVGTKEAPAGQFSVAIGEAVDGVDWVGVTNNTDVEWPEGAEAYVGVAGADAADARAMLLDHETRIAALEGAPVADSASADDEDEWVDDDDKPAKKKKGKK